MQLNQVFSIRGATTVCANTVEEITLKTIELLKEIITENNLNSSELDVFNIFCTTTADVTAFYPVRAIRESSLMPSAALFSSLEPPISGALELCIRLMLQVNNYSNKKILPRHVYLQGAKILRKDLTIN